MILTGQSLCLPSPATVQELFFVAQDANIIPEVSLDPFLTTFLSLDSSAALDHQYAFLQRSMNRQQQAAFRLNLTAELAGSSRIRYGGVGVIALALSLLFDQVAQQVRTQESAVGRASPQSSQVDIIFGISSSSRIGWIIQSYLQLIPAVANNQDKMAETTELYDEWLKVELIDHYQRMINKKRMSSVSMQQWLTGAAVHLHMRIHQVRLQSVPTGSAESLRLSYKTGLTRLVHSYITYLRRNIKETEASGPPRPRTRTDTFNVTSIHNSTHSREICKTNGSSEVSGPNGSAESPTGTVHKQAFTSSSGTMQHGEHSGLGLLVIEPLRNVSHSITHRRCESPAIEQALVKRIVDAQDLHQNRDFFLHSEKVFQNLLRQNDDFDLTTK